MKTIEERISAVRAALVNVSSPKSVTWDEFWDMYSSFLPQIASGENFEYDDETDVETTPIWDEDVIDERLGWSEYAYKFDIGLNSEDGLFVSVRRFDGDCTWDQVGYYCENDGSQKEFENAYTAYANLDDYFIGWAEYYCWCAENGCVDPLESFYNSANCTIENFVKAAEDNVRCLRMGK